MPSEQIRPRILTRGIVSGFPPTWKIASRAGSENDVQVAPTCHGLRGRNTLNPDSQSVLEVPAFAQRNSWRRPPSHEGLGLANRPDDEDQIVVLLQNAQPNAPP